MRSLHVISSLRLSAGGPTQSVTQLCEALNRMGHAAEIATVDSPDALAWEGKTPIHSFPAAFPDRLRRSPGLARFLRNEASSFDLIHVHGLWQWPGLYARRAADRQALPLVISPRGMVEPWALAQAVVQKGVAWGLWERQNLRSAVAFCATSLQEGRNLRLLGLRQPIAIVPNAQAFPIPQGRHSAERRTLLFLSRLHPKKGIDFLLHAWGRIAPAFPEWDLVVAGPGEPAHEVCYRQMIKDLKLERVYMPGPVYGEAKWKLLGRAELMVLPSHSENFGNAIAEALSQGVPVITTVQTPWSCLQEDQAGWWIPVSLEALENALCEALSKSDSELRDMGERGRTWVLRELDPDAVAAKLLETYRWLCDPHLPRPSCLDLE